MLATQTTCQWYLCRPQSRGRIMFNVRKKRTLPGRDVVQNSTSMSTILQANSNATPPHPMGLNSSGIKQPKSSKVQNKKEKKTKLSVRKQNRDPAALWEKRRVGGTKREMDLIKRGCQGCRLTQVTTGRVEDRWLLPLSSRPRTVDVS